MASVDEKSISLETPTPEPDDFLVASPDNEDFPEGGWRAASTLFAVWLIQFSSFGYTNAYGVYNDYYVRVYMEGKYTSSQLSWIGSVQLMLGMSMGLFTGRLFDVGYFYHLMMGGSALFLFCLFMLSLTQPGQYYQVFLAHGVGIGLAVGLMYVPGLALLSHWFRRRRSIAMSIATSGSGLGGAIHPIMLNRLFHGKVGFHWGVRYSAFMNLILILIALSLMRTRLPPRRKRDGSTLQHLRVFMKDSAYVFTAFGTLIGLGGFYFPLFFLQLSAIKNGISHGMAFYVLTIVNGANTIGRVFPSFIIQYIGVWNIVVSSVASCAVLIFCTISVKNVVGTIMIALLYGFFYGVYGGVFAPMVTVLAKDDSEIGARLGICFFFTGFGGLIGSPIAGALLTSSFIWWRPITFAGLCVTVSTMCFFMTRMILARRKGTQKI